MCRFVKSFLSEQNQPQIVVGREAARSYPDAHRIKADCVFETGVGISVKVTELEVHPEVTRSEPPRLLQHFFAERCFLCCVQSLGEQEAAPDRLSRQRLLSGGHTP